MLTRAEILDPDLLARLAATIPGPPSVHPLRGIHDSPRRGASLEFSEHSEYVDGEDIRDIDWKVYAKTDRFYVRRYEDERLQQAMVLLDASASMAYGATSTESLAGSKFHVGARVSAALAQRLVRQGDAVGLTLAGPDGHRRGMLPRSGDARFEALLTIMADARPAGRARMAAALRILGQRLKRSAAVFVVSDFLDQAPADLDAMAGLVARGIRPRIIQVLHRDEIDLPFDRTTRFLDMEGEGRETLDPEAVRRAYVEEIGAYVGDFAGRAEDLGLPYTLLIHDENPADALIALLRATRREG